MSKNIATRKTLTNAVMRSGNVIVGNVEFHSAFLSQIPPQRCHVPTASRCRDFASSQASTE